MIVVPAPPGDSPRSVLIFPAFIVGVASHVYVIDGQLEQRLKINTWNQLEVRPTATIGCVNKSLPAVTVARRNGVGLPPLAREVVYRPHWFHPTVLSGSAEPYNPDERSLRAWIRRVPPPPTGQPR